MVESCRKHNKDFEFYCVTHSTSICSKCAIFEHKSCSVLDLSDMADYETVKKLATDLGSQFTGKITDLETDGELAESKVIGTFGWLKQNLQQIEDLTLGSLRSKRQSQHDHLEERKKNCESILRSVDDKIQEMSTAQAQGSNKHVEIVMRDLKTLSETYTEQLSIESENVSSESQNLGISVSFDGYIIETDQDGSVRFTKEGSTSQNNAQAPLRQATPRAQANAHVQVASASGVAMTPSAPPVPSDKDLPSYDQVVHNFPNLSTNEGTPYPYAGNMQSPYQSPPVVGGAYAPNQPIGFNSSPERPFGAASRGLSSHLAPYPNPPESTYYSKPLNTPNGLPLCLSPSQCTSFSARTFTDSEHCEITGIAFLRDDRIVLADKRNKKLKLFDQNFTLQSEVLVAQQPYDVTQTPSGQIAVSLPKQGVVQMLFAAETLSVDHRSVLAVHKCQGLTASNTHLFVAGKDHNLDDTYIISVFDAQNIYVQRIPLHISNYGQLEICPKLGNLYYKSLAVGKEKIYCMSQSGQILWKTKVKSWIDQPYGFAAVNSGLFVSLDKIYFIECGHPQWNKVADTEYAGPLSVSIDLRRLAVAGRSGGTTHPEDSVSVYTITYSEP